MIFLLFNYFRIYYKIIFHRRKHFPMKRKPKIHHFKPVVTPSSMSCPKNCFFFYVKPIQQYVNKLLNCQKKKKNNSIAMCRVFATFQSACVCIVYACVCSTYLHVAVDLFYSFRFTHIFDETRCFARHYEQFRQISCICEFDEEGSAL